MIGEIDILYSKTVKDTAMADQQEYYFDYFLWEIIKEYAGIYSTMSAGEFKLVKTLRLAQLKKICDKYGLRVGGYTSQWYQPYDKAHGSKWHDMYNLTYRQQESKEIYGAYMRCYPDSKRALHSIMPPVNPHEVTKEVMDTINLKLGQHNVLRASERFVKEQKSGAALLCYHIAQHKDRKEIYKKLKNAVNDPHRNCVCGATVSQKPGMLSKHLKSVSHCKYILCRGNIPSIEQWYKASGEMPPGFDRDGDGNWTHIIPEDPKRSINHVIAHTGSVNLAKHMSKNSRGINMFPVPSPRSIIH